jgi:hypothetical protein
MTTLMCITLNPVIARGIITALDACGLRRSTVSIITARAQDIATELPGEPPIQLAIVSVEALAAVPVPPSRQRPDAVLLPIPGGGSLAGCGPLGAAFGKPGQGPATI